MRHAGVADSSDDQAQTHGDDMDVDGCESSAKGVKRDAPEGRTTAQRGSRTVSLGVSGANGRKREKEMAEWAESIGKYIEELGQEIGVETATGGEISASFALDEVAVARGLAGPEVVAQPYHYGC